MASRLSQNREFLLVIPEEIETAIAVVPQKLWGDRSLGTFPKFEGKEI